MKDPCVSVIIPAYNCASTLTRAVESALCQKAELEVLVINDCSAEDLDPVMARFREDDRVIYLKNEENLGVAQTRNRGVAAAKGRYIAFLDADDYWTPDKLEKQLAVLEDSGAVLCCTARELMTPEGVCTGRIIPVKREITYREILKHNSISCSSVVIRREAAQEFPMGNDDSHEDYIMWMRVLKKYGFAVGINEPLLKYRLSNTGKSGSKLQSAKMTYTAYRYAGLNPAQAALCFCSYAVHGVKKYYLSGNGEKYET